MSQAVAAVVSAPGPTHGPSSPDFQFIELPANGSLTVNVSDNPSSNSITFSLLRDVSAGPDNVVAVQLRNDSRLSASIVGVGNKYLIANPSNAGSQTFVVTFTAG